MSKKKRSQKTLLASAGPSPPSVSFPVAGEQDCGSEGTPFIARCALGSSTIAGAKLVTPGGEFPGTRLTAEEMEDDGGQMAGFPDHVFIGDESTNWAFVFSGLDMPPADTPVALVVTAANVDGTASAIIPLEHHVPEE